MTSFKIIVKRRLLYVVTVRLAGYLDMSMFIFFFCLHTTCSDTDCLKNTVRRFITFKNTVIQLRLCFHSTNIDDVPLKLI